MRNLLMSLLVVSLMTMSFGGTALAKVEGPNKMQPPKSNVQLTESQQKELAKLHKKVYKLRKQIIKKYVEYGVMPKEKGDEIKGHMKKHYKKMKKRGYIPNPHKMEKKHMK